MLSSSWIPAAYGGLFQAILVSAFIVAAVSSGAVMVILLTEGRARAAGWLMLETLVLVSAFALLHPLFALGAYFLCWHSMRHLSHIRILGDPKSGLGWLYRLSGPFFFPSLVVIGLLAWHTGSFLSPERIAIIILIFFAIVTPAHQWLVSRELQAPAPTI